jgi:hypothetical protein
MRVGRQTVHITRPQKVLFPDDDISKRQLAAYYEHIASTMLPHLHDRPVTMERYPDGITGTRLIQKRAASYFPRWIRTASMKKQNGTVRHVICQDAATLVYLANQACITPHVWLSRIDKPHHPDQMIFDLDPSGGGDFRAVCRAALTLRELLKREHLYAFVKTTGSRGLCADRRPALRGSASPGRTGGDAARVERGQRSAPQAGSLHHQQHFRSAPAQARPVEGSRAQGSGVARSEGALTRTVRLLLLVLGLAIFALLVWHAGPRLVLSMLRCIGWSFFAVAGIYVLHLMIRAAALRRTIFRVPLGYTDALRIRLAGDTVEKLTLTGPFLAVPAKGWLLKQRGGADLRTTTYSQPRGRYAQDKQDWTERDSL